tara:strand:- start:806 stop:1573 length:768 start_codon:yes stop_codon:yes gene_type:complete
MAKRRFRIEGGRYGGELVLGKVNPAFASYYADKQDEVVDAVLEAEDDNINEEEESDALLDPEGVPHPAIPGEYFYMWENDDLEHINSAYADGGFSVYEVPADGSDDWDYDKEVYEGDGIHVYGREGGYFGHDEPEIVNEEDEDGNKYVPVLAFHSSEKGGFGAWFVDTDEPFDEFKLGYGVVETNLAEFIDSVYYDKQELDCDYDYNDTTGKSYDAEVGWLNIKWHDSQENVSENMEEYWLEYEDNAEYEREHRV